MRNLNYDAWESESVEYPGILTLLAPEDYPNLLAQLFWLLGLNSLGRAAKAFMIAECLFMNPV